MRLPNLLMKIVLILFIVSIIPITTFGINKLQEGITTTVEKSLEVSINDNLDKSQSKRILREDKKEGMPKRQFELTERRTRNAKHYLMSDGSAQMEIYLNDIHYEDQYGSFQEIDTTIFDESDLDLYKYSLSKEVASRLTESLRSFDNGMEIQNLNNKKEKISFYRALKVPFDTSLPKDFSLGYSISKGNETLSFVPQDSRSVVANVYGNKLLYSDVWESTDVIMEVQTDGIKESIILKNNESPSIFSFKINGHGNEQISNLNSLFIHPAWLEDSTGQRRDVEQIFRNEGNDMFVDLKADTNGLIFPVTIDPTVTVNSPTKDTYYSYKDPLNYDYGNHTSDVLHIGYGTLAFNEAYLQFDISSIPSSNSIISAKLNMYVLGGDSPSGSSYHIFKVLGPWNESTIHFLNQPLLSSSYLTVSTGNYGGCSCDYNLKQGWSEMDITKYILDWKNGEPNYGIKINDNRFIVHTKKTFASKEYPDQTLTPKIVVTYNSTPGTPKILLPNTSTTVDATYQIAWSAATDLETPQSGLKYQIQLSTNNGSTWNDIVSLSSAGATSYTYNFSSVPNTATAKIRIRAYDGMLYGAWNESEVFVVKHNQAPNAPINTSPGGKTNNTSEIVSTLTPTLTWAFSDPDAGDIQSAYKVSIFRIDSSVLWDTGWISSTINSYTVPSEKLTRGITYYWKVQTKDLKGDQSPQSGSNYIKVNSLPDATFISYTNGQTIPDNLLTFIWDYSDIDNHTQSKYQIQGSKDNWATISYNTGEISSTNKTHTSIFSQGVWSFRLRVFDGYEWSIWTMISNLTLPNSYEPNETFEQAFPIQYNQSYSTTISSTTDVDFYKFTANKAGVDQIVLFTPVDKNYDVILYDSNMNYLGSSSNPNGPENILIFVQPGQIYFIKIYGVSGAFGNDPYTLRITNFAIIKGTYQTEYQYDNNGNLITKTTTNPTSD